MLELKQERNRWFRAYKDSYNLPNSVKNGAKGREITVIEDQGQDEDDNLNICRANSSPIVSVSSPDSESSHWLHEL